jgi:hypothetical protein
MQRGKRWYSGDQPYMDDWSVPLGDCVTLFVGIGVADEVVHHQSFVYTCPTRVQALSR